MKKLWRNWIPKIVSSLLVLCTWGCDVQLSSEPRVSFQEVNFIVEVADTPQKRSQGLMFRDALADTAGMIFVFPQEQMLSFWMKNTRIPLDIIFLDKDLKVVHIETAVPCAKDPCPSYRSPVPAQYALEINAGLADVYDITAGSVASFYNIN